MKLAHIPYEGRIQLALVQGGYALASEVLQTVVDFELPTTIDELLSWAEIQPHGYELALERLEELADAWKANALPPQLPLGLAVPMASLLSASPVLKPSSCRDAYAFRQHVEAARRNRGVEMIPEFDHYPVFYFTNHLAVGGPGPVAVMADHLKQLDYELEAAIVIGKPGRNIRAEDAHQHILGITIMNDWSARTLQMEEMKLNLGPAKGKDFASSLGPVLVSLKELESFAQNPRQGHKGTNWNLEMSAYINGKEFSRGSLASMDWTFAEIVERASYGVTLRAGDVIGSGTVGTGCLLEINGTRKLQDPAYQPVWLRAGDVVELYIEGIGTLRNEVVLEDDWSILAQKKG